MNPDSPTIEVSPDGSRRWRVSGKYHRTDGPAIEWADGTRQWRVNGELHRTDGPAIEWADGDRAWYIRGQLHRTDGPAIEWADGTRRWRISGKELDFRQWLDAVTRTEAERVELIMRWL